jgi:glycosyltransferase involved in cell wall biosynthesis
MAPAASRVAVVLPALDEVRALPGVLAGLPTGYQAIVVDNGSTDGTGDLARALGATVVVEPRRGFGAACAAGLAAATSEVVAFCDCDGSLDLAQLPEVCQPVLDGTCRLAVGRRVPTTPRAWPLHARAANRVLARRLRRDLGLAVTDLGPMRAARREDWTSLGVVDRRSGWPLEQLVRAGVAGWEVLEVPVVYRPRLGRSKVTGTVRGTLLAVADMRRVLADLAPAVSNVP